MDVGIVSFAGNHRVCDVRGRQAIGQVWTGAAEGCLPLWRDPYITLLGQEKSWAGVGGVLLREM